MKNTFITAGIALIITAVIGGSVLADSTSTKVQVGVIAPLTGPLAEYGVAFKNGIELAQKASGNTDIEFIFEDSAYDPKQAVSAYNKLVNVDRVSVVMNWGDPTSQAIAPVAAQNADVAFLAFSSLTDIPGAAENTVRMFDRPETFAARTWDALRAQGIKRIAVVKVENQYLNTHFAEMKRQARADETVDLVEDVQSFGVKDFRTTIAKIKASPEKYDAVGVYLGSGQIGQFYKQLAEQNVTLITFGTDFFESQSDIDEAGAAINGALYAHYDVSNEFKATYRTAFGNVSQIAYAGNAYDAAMVLLEGNVTDGASALSAVTQVTNYTGVMGTYSYTTNADGDKYLAVPVHVKKIQDGMISVVR